MRMLWINALGKLIGSDYVPCLVSFCIPGALLVHASPYGFDSQVGSGTAMAVLSRVLRGDEVEALTSLGKWK